MTPESLTSAPRYAGRPALAEAVAAVAAACDVLSLGAPPPRDAAEDPFCEAVDYWIGLRALEALLADLVRPDAADPAALSSHADAAVDLARRLLLALVSLRSGEGEDVLVAAATAALGRLPRVVV